MRPGANDLQWLDGYSNTDNVSYVTIGGKAWDGGSTGLTLASSSRY